MRVRDDGRGFDPEVGRRQARRGDSFGLLGMRERATLIGGELDIDSSPGTGTLIRARLPLAQQPAAERRRSDRRRAAGAKAKSKAKTPRSRTA